MRFVSPCIIFFVVTVNGAAFNPIYKAASPSLNSRASSVIPAHLDKTQPQIPNPSRLHSKRPRWFPSVRPNRPPRRRLPNPTTKRSPAPAVGLDMRPTPEPTGDPSASTTVHITDQSNFSLVVPNRPGELISDAEADGTSYCAANSTSSGTCPNILPLGFITAAAVERSDDGAYIQVTGCIDPTKYANMDPSDDGGQFDVRFPNGAQCTYGGYGASFIEQIEPSARRFCLRCCQSQNDQVNCNSHQDRKGCTTAIPGVYRFPDLGIDCS